jgi:SAM-dependent methyltransferase
VSVISRSLVIPLTPQNRKRDAIVLRWPLTKIFRDWVEALRYGPLAIAAYPFDLIRVRRAERAERFDELFGTDTATVVYPWNLPSVGREHSSEIHVYEATPAWLIREILGSIPLQPHKSVFVDMGSGKGRALLVASEFPFAKIVGVEISRELHQVAEENIKRYRPASQQCTTFSLHCMNAVEYTFGPEPLVLFLFNPFGQDTVRSILANLEASLRATPREVFVVYINARFEALARSAPFLRRVRKGGAWWRPWNQYVTYAASPAWDR